MNLKRFLDKYLAPMINGLFYQKNNIRKQDLVCYISPWVSDVYGSSQLKQKVYMCILNCAFNTIYDYLCI